MTLLMKILPIIYFSLTILLLAACEHDNTDRWKFRKYSDNTRTPKLARDIFANRQWDLSEESHALALLDSLNAKEIEARPFYFKVVTLTYAKSDGSFSEGLGNAGYDYVKDNTSEFLNYFIGDNSFTKDDLKIWANIILLELSISAEDNLQQGILNYIKELKSKKLSTEQTAVLDEFCLLLKTTQQ